MSNFIRSLFGVKKAAKVTKSKMQTRRLELIGLEERITPTANLALSGAGVLSLTATSAESLTVSASGQVLTFTATGNITVAGSVAGSSGGGSTFVTVDLSNAAYAGALLNLISLNGNAAAANSTLSVNGNLDLTAVTGTTSIGLTLQEGNAANDDDANITGLVKTKGAGAVTVNVTNTATSTLFINNLGDITTSTGAVALTGRTINTGGDVTTTSGAIGYTSTLGVFLNSNVATTSTLAAGNLSITGALALAGFNFTADQGLGNVTTISGGVSGIGSLKLTGAVVTPVGAISITGNGELNATATTGDLTFAAGVSAPTVKATSLLGNVVFSSTVASTVGKIEVSAVTATKAISIANTVTGANNSNITLTGDVLSTNSAAQLTSSGNGVISIVGKVSASVAGNNFTISGSGAVSISGVVDSTIGNFTVSGTGTLNLGNNITTQGTTGITLSIAKTILTADVALKTTGAGSDITISGTVDGAKKLTLETPAVAGSNNIVLTSVGQTTALNTVTVTTSGGVQTGLLTATNVVLTDTVGTIAFGSFGSNPATTISALTTFVKGYNVSFTGNTVLSGTPVFLNTGDVNFQDNVTLTAGATITGNATSTVTMSSAPLIISNGAFNIGALPTTTIGDGTAFVLNSTTAASTFAGKVALGAANGFDLLGNGTLTLSGDSSTSLLGSIDVINGTLNVTGKIGASSVSAANNGTISGPDGTIGVLQVITGTVAPGGTLNTAAVTLNSSTNYKVAVLTSGATPTGSNLKTAAAINLGNAVLQVTSVANGLKVGDKITIIDNTASTTTPIVGTFANLAEGATVTGAKDAAGNAITYTISYVGGTGSDNVVLTVKSVTSATPVAAPNAQPMVAGQPALNKFTAIGTDQGGGPLVTVTFNDGTYSSFFAYDPSFRGGVRVAIGDVNGDGTEDLITGAGPGGAPQVNVYIINSNGSITLQTSFIAFNEPLFRGGVYVAAGHTDGETRYAEVVVGAGAGGGSRVQVYEGSANGLITSKPINDFFAYSPAFTGGVVVAVGQRNGAAGEEVITAPASNGGFNIRSFDCNGTGNSPTLVDNFFAFNDITSVGGLSIAAGLLDADGIADIVVGSTLGGFGVIHDSDTSGLITAPFPGFAGAIRAGVAEDSTGKEFAVALAGPGGAPRVSVYSVSSTSLTEVDNLFVLNPAFRGGLFGSASV